ncbi:MFS transporter [Streptomyces sp. BHT-5-2]|uniref:MFS transporter n=1 Tax=Streptomyces sp. BHT-5-2 TaxID=2866715 RepID=UPI001C8E985F|nr:MFS transporter [Streptomyces sp. BHT-5-2]QZL04266.1 MFS transporter [Streptomyces sp. BHT-5-2]
MTSARTPAAAPASAEHALHDTTRTWRAVLVAMSGTFMAIMDVFIVLIAAPAIQRNLHATDAEVQFVLAGYQLTYAVTLVTGGRLGDLYGRKRIFQTGLLVFTVASLACGLAPTAGVLIAARLVQGVGAALLFPQVFAMIQVLLPESRRGRAYGILGAVIGMSTIVGQVLGGLLVQSDLFGTSWRPVFWINVPIGAVALLLSARLLPESRAPQARRLDPAGTVVLTVALFLLVFPLIEGREVGWPTWTWLCLAGAVLALAALAWVERRVSQSGRSPLVEPKLFRQRAFLTGLVLILIYYSALNSFFLILSITLQDGLGLSAVATGLVYTPQAIAFFLASLLAGRLIRRHGRRVLEAGAAIALLGFAATIAATLAAGAHLNAWIIMPCLIVQGFGEGLLQTPLLNAILSRIDEDHVGLASGALSTAQQVGGALGVAVIGVLFYNALGSARTGQVGVYAHGFGIATVFNAVVLAAVTALVFLLPTQRRADTA